MDDGEGKYVGACRCVAPTLAICIAPAVIISSSHTEVYLINVPCSLASYLTNLTVLKQLLSDIQYGLGIPFRILGAVTDIYRELTKEFQDKLYNAQSHEVLFMARNVL